MSDSTVILIVLIACAVFIVAFATAMFFIVRSHGVERRHYGKLTRGDSPTASRASSIM